jgi:hypothetical protein
LTVGVETFRLELLLLVFLFVLLRVFLLLLAILLLILALRLWWRRRFVCRREAGRGFLASDDRRISGGSGDTRELAKCRGLEGRGDEYQRSNGPLLPWKSDSCRSEAVGGHSISSYHPLFTHRTI